MPHQILRYQQKLSGPILDRIDLYSSVHEINHRKLLTQAVNPQSDQSVRDDIARARQLQHDRYGKASKLNAAMTNADIKKFGRLASDAQELLNGAAERLNISARAYMRCVKVARTIADLEGSVEITSGHISEALAYRSTAAITSTTQ